MTDDDAPRRSPRPPRQPQLPLPGSLVLRPWTPDDTAGLLLAVRDPAVRRYAGRLIDSRTQAMESVRLWARSWIDGTGAAWAVADRSGQVLGSLRFQILDLELRCGSVGYWLLPEARGRGVAAHALRTATSVVFRRLDWHRIELYHAVENERSCNVARRSGYLFEGVMREAMRYPVDGRWSDEHLHARLASDPVDVARP